MIRQPALRLFQCSLFGALTLLGGMLPKAKLPQPEPLWFSVSLVGEYEREDGSWQGVDLLRTPDAKAERFQVTVSSNVAATAELWTVGRHGPLRLHDEAVKLGRRKAYAFPSPTAFYELEGDSPLRLVVCRKGEREETPATLQAVAGHAIYPLSDGGPFQVEERVYDAKGCGVLTLGLKARGG